MSAVHQLIIKEVKLIIKNKYEALRHAFFRLSAPNLSNMVATVVMAFIMIYFHGYHLNMVIGDT